MATRILLSWFAVLAGLLGCSGMQTRYATKQPSPECSVADRKCQLEIEVTDCSKTDGYTVTNSDLWVTLPSKIEWTIKTPGYSFSYDQIGIDIRWKNGAFDQPQQHGPRKFSWRDKHSDAGIDFKPGEIYYYSINIRKDGGADCVPFDPWISNW